MSGIMVTVHLSDGRKITKDSERLVFFNPMKRSEMPDVKDGNININTLHVVDYRPADEMEKQHARIHGW